MIGTSGQNGRGAVDLFGQHGADQGVRPGLWAECETSLRSVQHRLIQPIGAADGEDQTPNTVIAQAPEERREIPRASGFAMLVAGEQMAAVQPVEQGLAFGGFSRLSGLNLDHVHRPQTQRSTRKARPFGPVHGQARLRRRAKTTDAKQSYLHGMPGAGGLSERRR